MQEVITLPVFAGFSVLYLGEGLRWNHAAAFACLVAAVWLMFRGSDDPGAAIEPICSD